MDTVFESFNLFNNFFFLVVVVDCNKPYIINSVKHSLFLSCYKFSRINFHVKSMSNIVTMKNHGKSSNGKFAAKPKKKWKNRQFSFLCIFFYWLRYRIRKGGKLLWCRQIECWFFVNSRKCWEINQNVELFFMVIPWRNIHSFILILVQEVCSSKMFSYALHCGWQDSQYLICITWYFNNGLTFFFIFFRSR